MPAATAPESLGRYRLLAQIGEGGMGIVYLAEEQTPSGPRSVVVKRVRPELVRDTTFLRMMQHEARLGARLRHPGLVPVLELGEHDGETFLVLEYVDGFDLAQILDRAIRIGARMPLGVACYIALEAARALEYAHALTDDLGKPLVIAHRDISPSNLMVTKAGAVKLLDFGIAKAADSVTDERTRTGIVKGKLSYFSPEQAEGHALDARSDLFSLGIVLMESLLERRLFRGNSELDTLRRVREAEIPRPSTLRSDIDNELERVLLTLLHKRREERYPNARAFADALAPIVARLGGNAEVMRGYLDELAPITPRSSARSSQNAAIPTAVDPVPEAPSRLEDPTRISPQVKAKRRFGFLRGREDVPPVEPPGRIAAPRPEDVPRLAGRPRWRAYVDSLPDGLQSFPECTIKAALLRLFHEQLGHPSVPRDAPKALQDLVNAPPLVSSYVSGVVGRAFFLALADELGLDDDEFIARTYANNVKMLASPLYKMLFTVVSTDRLIRNVKSRWMAFHRGIDLDVPEFGKGYAHGVFRSPPGFEPIIALRMHATGLRAGLEAVGAKDMRSKLTIVSPSEALVDFTWT